jgi:uncharacterized membrane protein YccC
VRSELVAAVRTRWAIGLRAALSLGLPLLVGVAAGRPSWGALASIGGFAGFYGAETPYRHRARLVAAVGLTLAIVVPVGSLCAPHATLAIAFVGLVTGVASFTCLALAVPPPREYLIVLAALASTGIPATGSDALRECWLVAAGALVGALISTSPAWTGRRALPQTRALNRAWAAIAALLAGAGTPEAARCQRAAVAAVRTARDTLRQAGAGAATATGELLSLAAAEMVLASALSVSIDATEALPGSAPAAVADLQRLSLGGPAASAAIAPPTGVPGLDQAIESARRLVLERPGDAVAPDRPTIRERLREAVESRTVVLPTALRVAVAVAAGAGIGRILGLDHSYWVGLTAAAALQANQVTLLLRRALHRMAGTVVGVAVVGLVFSLGPARGVVAAMAFVAQGIAETLIRASYAIAIVFVTVIALSVYDLAVPGAGLATGVGARVIDTAIGAALVVVLRLVLWPRAHEARLPRAEAAAIRVAAQLFADRWQDRPAAELARGQRRLQERLLELRTLAEGARGDRILTAREAHDDRITEAVEELAMLALGVPYGRTPPSAQDALALARTLARIAEALETGEAVDVPPVPELPGYPRTRAATGLLRGSLGRPRQPVSDEFSPPGVSTPSDSQSPTSGGL